MAAIAKDELERMEREYGLEPDDLTYQHRCSRIVAYQKGEGDTWEKPSKPESRQVTETKINKHPLYGKRLLITPMMTPDKNRNLAFEERLGPEITVRDVDAGEKIQANDSMQRMVGDYEILNIDETKTVYATTTFPKIGTEISWKLGEELCPVAAGNDGSRGYVWSFPTSIVQVGDSMIQLYGLKTLIRQVYPELEPKFKGKPIMSYVDGITLVASIPQTHALLKEHRRQEMLAQKAGLGDGYGLI